MFSLNRVCSLTRKCIQKVKDSNKSFSFSTSSNNPSQTFGDRKPTRSNPVPTSSSDEKKHFRRNAIYSSPPVSATMRKWLPPEPILNPKSLHIAIIGSPNAGKSTLLNCLLETTVSAVSPKYNTTNDKILGIYTHKNTQLVVYDTPGFLIPPNHSSSSSITSSSTSTSSSKYDYIETLVSKSVNSMKEVDVVLFVLDIAKRFDNDTIETMKVVLNQCKENQVKVLLVANKIDLLRGKNITVAKKLFPIANTYASSISSTKKRAFSSKDEEDEKILEFKLHLLQDSFESMLAQLDMIETIGKEKGKSASSYIFPISATSNEGVEELRTYLLQKEAKNRTWEYNSKLKTDLSDVELVEQVIRGKIFENLHAEVPYSITQQTRSWNVLTSPPERVGELVIDQDIQVPSSRIASMLLTRKAGAIKKITTDAIAVLSQVFGVKVHLFLHIVVKS